MAKTNVRAESASENTLSKIHELGLEVQNQADRLRTLLNAIDATSGGINAQASREGCSSDIVNLAMLGLDAARKIDEAGAQLELIGMGRTEFAQ